VAAHPCRWWIRHPERIVSPAVATALRAEREARLEYHAAVLRALDGVRESEELCARITSIADEIDCRVWPWAASPQKLEPSPPSPPSRWHRLRVLATRRRRRFPQHSVGRPVRPTSRPIAP
jgi:hypothetical protein